MRIVLAAFLATVAGSAWAQPMPPSQPAVPQTMPPTQMPPEKVEPNQTAPGATGSPANRNLGQVPPGQPLTPGEPTSPTQPVSPTHPDIAPNGAIPSETRH
jgi:hypothetical protein